jgi:HD-like signal output (HDOD) protein
MELNELKKQLREEREKELPTIVQKIQEIEEKRKKANEEFDLEIRQLLGTDYVIVTKIEPTP